MSGADTPAASTAPGARLRTLIADDEPLARSLLVSLIRRDPGLELVGEAADGAEALRLAQSRRPDLVLLDVQMPTLGGLAVAERLAASAEAPHVVFVTAYDEHAIRAFELNALDYLVKPVEKARFRRSVERARAAVEARERDRLAQKLLSVAEELRQTRVPARSDEPIVVRRGTEILALQPREIVWIEAVNQYANLHTDRGTFLVAESLAEYERRLPPPAFLRIHRSTVVNARRTQRVLRRPNGTHEVLVADGTRLPVARSRRHLVADLLRLAVNSTEGTAS